MAGPEYVAFESLPEWLRPTLAELAEDIPGEDLTTLLYWFTSFTGRN